ncbi:MAG TPA: cytochrome c [Kofleriaceae bacterium]|nr:cytochrome c [Kofleriaceae bacterium]
MSRFVIIVLALAACRSEDKPAPAQQPVPTQPTPPAAPPVTIDRDALLAGKLPEGAPETDLVNAQCRICHSVEYLTQQRLGEAAWKKTIDKMRKFGAVLTDEQAASLVAFAAHYWNPDLPGRTWTPGPPPPGALPITTK